MYTLKDHRRRTTIWNPRLTEGSPIRGAGWAAFSDQDGGDSATG